MQPGHHLPSDQLVTVYYFETIDPVSSARVPSVFKTTRDEIEHRYAGIVLEGTAESVDASELDKELRYRRIASGWGALD